LRGCADIGESSAVVGVGGVGGVDGVAEGSFLADLGEEAAGHSAGEDGADDSFGPAGGVSFAWGVPGEGDVGLVGFVGMVVIAAGGGGVPGDGRRLAGPAIEEGVEECGGVCGIDIAGEGECGADGDGAVFPGGEEFVRGDGFEAGGFAEG